MPDLLTYMPTVKEIEKEYSWLWNKIKTKFAYLSEEEQRKIFLITYNVCAHCYNTFVPCQCWNDE